MSTSTGGGPRVLVIDDHTVFAEALAAALIARDFVVTDIARTGAAALTAVTQSSPDVVLVDQRLPDVTGTELLRALRGAAPDAALVMLTAQRDERTVIAAVEAGCRGYVTKDQSLDELVDAVRRAAMGEVVLSPALLARVLPLLRSDPPTRGELLTPRELEILELMSEGLSNRAIAGRLFLSVNTVRNHVRNMLAKLDAHSKLEAVAIATRRGLIAPPTDAPS
ncbi:MAG: response regulator transcription factor [Acidimicrobiia bacterium]|nr:response regulator transcription factor [Acidimicrobiia bacterium]